MKIKLLVFSLLCSFVAWGQLTEGFETGMPTAYTATTSYTLGSGTWTGQANGVVRGTVGVNSGVYSCQLRSQTGAQITTPNITTTVGSVTFWGSSSTTSGSVQVNYSTDGGTVWIPAIGSPFALTTGTPVLKTATINNSSPNILVQFYRTAATVYLDNISISAVPSGNTITVTQATGGTITPVTATYANGSSQAFTATPTSCYDFTSWTIDGVPNASTTNPYTFTNITANHTITAVYTIKTSAITATAGANGSISPSGVTNLNCGTNQAYTITPSAGYVVQDVLVDGVSVGAVTSYTFTSVTAGPHTISASFVTAPAGPCLNEGFLAGTTAPTGWAFTNIGGTYTSVGNFGVSSPSLQFDATNDIIETPTVTNATELSFWLRGNGTNASSALLVEGYNGVAWITIENITNSIPTTGVTKTYNALSTPQLPVNLQKFRFTYTKSAGNLAFDDVNIICGPIVVGPEINIQGNSTSIIDGDNTPNVLDDTDFGTTTLSTNSVKTYTIQNTGTTDLILSLPITLTDVSIPQEFTITQPASATVAVGSSINFTVTFNSAIGGTFTNTLNINSNDANEALYNFDITATATSIVNNDLCTNAIEILVNMPAISGNMSGATRTPNPFNTKIDRWYKFTPTCSSTHAIIVSGFSGDIDIELFSGSCPASTTYLDTSAGTSSTEIISMALTTGTTYYLRVLAWNAAAETSVFNVQVTAGSSLNISNVGSPATGNINTGTANAVIMGITTTPACALNYEITTITLTKAAASTATTTDISNFRIYHDTNGNGAFDGGDSLVSNAVPLSNSMTFTLIGQTGIATERKYLLVADVSPAAIIGRNIKVDLSPNSNLTAILSPAGTKNGIALGNIQTFVASPCAAATIVSVMPASGPAGTQVTITASSGNLTGATASFNGAAATVVSSSTTQLVVIVPVGATTGNLIVTDNQPCPSAIPFTIINQDKTSCQSSTLISDLFISEVTDASSGSLTYVEIYNGTSSSIDMASGNYAVRFTNFNATLGDGNPGSDVDLSLVGVLAPGDKFIFATTIGAGCSVPGGDGSLADQTGAHSGINNNDSVKLLKNGTIIDRWGFDDDTRYWITDLGLGDKGFDFERKNTVSAPSTTFLTSDWIITDWDNCSDDYSNIETYVAISSTPTITTQPALSLTCTSTSATINISATEGFANGLSLAYQWYAVAPNTSNWTALSNGGLYSGVTTNTLSISSVATLEGYQYYCQVREDSASCYIATNAVIINTGATIWNGTSWSNGIPTLAKAAIINGNYNTNPNGNISCCNLAVNPTFTVVIAANNYVEVQNNVINNGIFTIQDDGSLVQIDNSGTFTGTGTNTMIRVAGNVVPLKLYDYVYWSSPVASAPFSTIPNSRFYEWDADFVNPVGFGQGNWIATADATMQPGKGYIFRVPNANTTQTVTFSGSLFNTGIMNKTINKGTITAPFVGTNATITQFDDNNNLVGNPFPSAIDSQAFIATNNSVLEDGSVSLWRHLTAIATTTSPYYQTFVYNYVGTDYVKHNGTASLPAGAFDGKIASGQAFFVKMKESLGATANLEFRNEHRSRNHNNSQFFRTTDPFTSSEPKIERNRIWLDLVNPQKTAVTQVIAYVENATNGEDFYFDAKTGYKKALNFYSLINDMVYDIQARKLPFDKNDSVPLGVQLPTDGVYAIAINQADGIFSDKKQKIYIEDKLNGSLHDLTQSPYEFVAVKGISNDRFSLRFKDKNEVQEITSEVQSNDLLVTTSDDQIKIESKGSKVANYEVYNVLGQSLAIKNAVHANKIAETSIQKSNQALLLKIQLENGQIFLRKIIF